ncbi:MAG: phosphatidylserine decarboxylase [Roseiflexaceae bacterium]|nr:phosphatidylserine decarboxylase [Roseiflexaceae bacterium]
MAPESDPYEFRVRLPGFDPAATPVVGVGLGLTGLILGLRPRFAALPLLLTAAAALMLRDPERQTPIASDVLYAPADGVVNAHEETYEHLFLHTDAIRLTIAVSPLDVPVQRSPISGRVSFLQEVTASQRIGWVQRGDEERGACLLIGIDAGWAPVLLAISTGAVAWAPQARVAIGDQIAAGARIAVARFGARVDLLVPCDLIAGLPQIGDHVQAGLTQIGNVVMR